MILNKKLIIIILFLFLSACKLDSSLCYGENDYGNNGDYDTVTVGAGNSMCNYDKSKDINSFSQSETIRDCLNETTIKDLSGNSKIDFIAEESRNKSCANFYSYIKNGNFSDITFILESEQNLNDYRNNKESILNDVSNPEYNKIKNEYDQKTQTVSNDKFGIINNIFDDCVSSCQEKCSSTNTTPQAWTSANLKGDGYLGVNLTKNTILNISVSGSVILDSDNTNTTASFSRYGMEDVNREFYLKNGDVTTLNLKLNKNFINVKETGVSIEETKKRNFKNRTYLTLKDYDPSLSYGDKYRMQEPRYDVLQCEYNEENKYTASCHFNYSSIITDNSDFKSIVEKYYNEKYVNQQIRVFNKNDYYLYADDAFNQIEYNRNNKEIIVKDEKGGINSGNSESSSDDENKIKVQEDTNNLIQVLNKFGSSDGYIWNDGKKEFKFTNKGPFKLAIKYLDKEDDSLNCVYSISYKDYNPVSNTNKGTKVDNNYIVVYSGNKWHTVKNSIKTKEDGTIATGYEEVIFNRFATPNNNSDEMLITFNVESGEEKCSRGIGIMVINLKDYLVYDNGFLMFAIPGINTTNNKIKYKLLNQDMIIMNTDRVIQSTDKITEFFEDNIELSYEELNISSSTDAEKLSNDGLSDLIDNKIIYVRKGQILRFDYSNWMDIDGKDKITLKDMDVSGINTRPYIGTGLNVFIKQQPLYICYGSASEAVSLENRCYNVGGTFESFNTANSEVGECYLKVNNCYIKGSSSGGILMDFNKINPLASSDNDCQKQLSEPEKEALNDMEYSLQSFITQQLIPSYDKEEVEYKIGDKKDKEDLNKLCYSDVIGNTYKQTLSCLNTLKSGKYKIYQGIVGKEEALENSREIITNDLIESLKNIKVNVNINDNDDKFGTVNIKITDDMGELNNNYISIKNCAINRPISLTLSNNTRNDIICSKLAKEKIFEALLDAIKKVFFVNKTVSEYSYKDNNNNEQKSSTTVYSDHFYYYKDVCDGNKTASGNCKENDVVQCYDFSNYRGSVEKAIKRITANSNNSSNISETDISIYGFLTALDQTLGANKLLEFNGKNGLIKNLLDSTETTSSDDTENYYYLVYSDNIYSNSTSTFAAYIINDFNTSGEDYKTNFKNLVKNSGIYSGSIMTINSESSHSYKNGDRLSVIIGRAKNSAGGSLYYYSETTDGKETGNIYYTDTEDVKAKNKTKNDYFPIVFYDNETKSLSKDSPFKFNEKGILVDANNISSKGVDFEKFTSVVVNYGKIQDYISKEGFEKNLYFKVIDIDNQVENNSGSYTIIINTYNATENKILAYFRDFFNKILSFIDGGYLRIEVDNKGNKVPCYEDNNSSYCYIYDENSVMYNGDGCTTASNEENCYSNCLIKEKEARYKGEICNSEYFYNGKGFIKNIFEMFINDHLYQFVAKIALVLAITAYGFSYFFGLSNFTQGEIITRILRFCFIYFIISPSGWDFFNNFIIKFFKDGVDSLLFLVASAFDSNLMSDVNRALNTGDFSDKSALFSTTFSNLELIFSEQIFNKMMGLAFSGWFGFIYLYLVLSAVINYITASLSAIVLYLSAQVYMSLVFCFFPLVVLFMFFEKTKKTFDNWIGLLIGFAGQQLFLIMTLSFFNLLVLTYIKMTFSYRVCLLPLFNISIGGIPLALITFWKIPGVSFSDPIEKVNEAMPSFYSIIGFYVVTVLMTKFITGMVEVGKTIFGGLGIEGGMAGKINGAISTVGTKGKSFMKKTGKEFGTGMAKRFLGGKAIDDYRKKQQEERTKRREARANFFKNLNKKVGERMNEYENGDELKKDLSEALKDNKEYQSLNNLLTNHKDTMSEGAQKRAREKMEKIENSRRQELIDKKRDKVSGEVAKEEYLEQYKNIIGEEKAKELQNDPEKLKNVVLNSGHALKKWFPEDEKKEKKNKKDDSKNNNEDEESDSKKSDNLLQ